MGNTKCKSCERELPKSNCSIEENVELNGITVRVKTHNNGQYYSLSKTNIIATAILNGIFPFLGTLINPQEDYYICWDCFWRPKRDEERRRKEERKKLREQRMLEQKKSKEEGKETEKEQRMLDTVSKPKRELLSKQKSLLDDISQQVQTVSSKRSKKEQEQRALHVADRKDVQAQKQQVAQDDETQALVQHMKTQESILKRTEQNVQKSLTMVKSRCSPREYANWSETREHISLCSNFSATERSSVQTSSLIKGGEASATSQSQSHGISFQLMKNNLYLLNGLSDGKSLQVTTLNETQQVKIKQLIHNVEVLLASEIPIDQCMLLAIQTHLFFIFSQKVQLSDIQEEMILEALSYITTSLNGRECAKLTIALALLCISIDEELLHSCQNNISRAFFQGLLYGCRDSGFYSGTCVTQCLHHYLQSCEEGVHYDQALLQMMAENFSATLWCVFHSVDCAVLYQQPVNLPVLKEKVHLIQTYNIHRYEHKQKLKQLKTYKEGIDRGWKMIKEEFLQLNPLPQSKEIWICIEKCVHPLMDMDISQKACDEYLSGNAIQLTVQALQRIQKSADPIDITMVMRTLSYAVCKFMKYKIIPRKTQLVSVCMLLLSQKEHVNRLLEVLTGEGKSCIIAMFAAALGMQGKKVDIITSSPVLARRDAKIWTKFFDIFGLTVAHNTDTPEFLALSETEANKKRSNCYKQTIVYGTVSSFSADILREEFEMKDVRSNRGSTAAVIDELDMLMLDEGVQFTYLSHRRAVLRHIEPVLAMVWSNAAQHTPILKTDGDVLFAGVPKSFHVVIYDGIDKDDCELDHPAKLLRFLLNVTSNEYHSILERLIEADSAESATEVLKTLSCKDLITFIHNFNNPESEGTFTFRVVPYSYNEQNVLESVGEESFSTEESTISVLVADGGILYPLYTQEELTQGIVAMISSQCNLPGADVTPNDESIMQSESGTEFIIGAPASFDDVISTLLDTKEVLNLSMKHFRQHVHGAQMEIKLLESQEECYLKQIEKFSANDTLTFLAYINNQCPLNIGPLYILDDKGELVRGPEMNVGQEMLVMEKGMLCCVTEVEETETPSQTSSTSSQLEQSPCPELLHGKTFMCGASVHVCNILHTKCDILKFLASLSSTEDREKLKHVRDVPNVENILSSINVTGRYLTCNIVAYTQDEKTDKLIQQNRGATVKKDTNGEPYPEVPIMITDNGALCKLYRKETVEVPSFLRPFVANQLPTWINSAFTALQMSENREYLVKDGKQIIPVDYLNSGVIEESKKWGGGLQQMLEMKHHLQISPMSVVTNFMSHVEFFKRYTREGELYGLSGTVGGVKDAEILNNLYRLEIWKIPTYRQSLRYERNTLFVHGERTEFLEQIHSVLMNSIEPKTYATHLHGAAALVLCEDIRSAKEIHSFLEAKTGNKLTLYDGEDSEISIEESPKDSGEIIVATNLAGRGTDIPVTDKVNDSGGLLCLMTFLPKNRRVELQAFGRTARCGNPGSVQYVLSVSDLPKHYRDYLDIEIIRELRQNEESDRLKRMLETDIKAVEVRESLFSSYCTFLRRIHDDVKELKDKQVIIDTINENWGQWLQTKQSEIEDATDYEVTQRKMITELEEVQKSWIPPLETRASNHPCMSPDYLRSANYHHLIKFGNQQLGTKCLPDKKKKAKNAMRYYKEAIKKEPNFTMIAHYNHACCTLVLKEDDNYIRSGIHDLEMARKQLQVFCSEVGIIMECAQLSRNRSLSDPENNHLLKQMEVRMQLLQFFGQKIDETLQQLKEFEKKGEQFKVVPSSILTFIAEADSETNEELYGLSQLGLEFAFTLEKKPRFCWEGLAVFVLGLLQITAGVCLLVLTTGALSQVGMGLISEGVSDCIDGVIGMVTGEWDWKEWGISKACSIGLSIACGGVGKFITKGAKVAKVLVKGAKATKAAKKATKATKTAASIATKAKTVVTDMKGMATVAKDSWGTAMKTNVKNAAKLVGKEMVQQGVMYGLGELENRAMKLIFNEIGKRIAQLVQQRLETSFLSSTHTHKELGYFVNCYFISKLSDSYAREKRIDPFLCDETKKYFACAADETVHLIVPESTKFSEVATRFRSLLPQISSHLKGKAAAVANIVEVGFVVQSLENVRSQLTDLTGEFLPELRKYCYKSLQNGQQSEATADELHMDDKYSLACVEELKKTLAQHSAQKLGEAVGAVLLENLSWMVNRGLSMTVNKFASEKLHKALDVDRTKQLIEAGQKANYLRSAPLGESHPGKVDVNAVHHHSKMILDEKTPGTLSELRIAAEAFNCRVVIEDVHGNRSCSLSSSAKGEKPEIVLVHIPNKDHPQGLGHYQVKVDGKLIEVDSKNHNCMFESFAHGLTKAKGGDDSSAIRGNTVREEVSKRIKDSPQVWSEHLARKAELMRIKEAGQEFLLTGGVKRGKQNAD